MPRFLAGITATRLIHRAAVRMRPSTDYIRILVRALTAATRAGPSGSVRLSRQWRASAQAPALTFPTDYLRETRTNGSHSSRTRRSESVRKMHGFGIERLEFLGRIIRACGR